MRQEAKDLSQFRKELEEIYSLTYEEQSLYMTKVPCISVVQQQRFCTQTDCMGGRVAALGGLLQ